MKKAIVSMLVVLLLSLNVFPVQASSATPIPASISEEDIVSPASEETVWYTRIYNGMLQRRLWSLTYQEWLTEWEDVQPVG